MGVPLDKVVVLLGDSSFPVSAGSDGQWGANNSTAGVYAACVKLREAIAQKLGHPNFPSMVVELPGRDGDSSFQGMDARRDAAKREYHSPWFREMEGVLLQARDLSGRVILSTSQTCDHDGRTHLKHLVCDASSRHRHWLRKRIHRFPCPV
jgi:hypothetical protein